jgi:hypothetical protein
MTRITVCVVWGAVALVVGCGGSNSSDGGSSFSSSVPGSATIGSLSDSDKQKLCNDLAAYVSSSTFKSGEVKASCSFAGVVGAALATDQTDAGVQAACKKSYDDCAAQITSAPVDASMCMPPGATCTATVSELTACLNADVAAFNSIDVPSCASLTVASLNNMTTDPGSTSQPMQPAACATFQMKCPGSGMM